MLLFYSNGFSNHEIKNNSVSHLFKVASQEIESTYSRSLEISEKYFDIQTESDSRKSSLNMK